MLIIDNVKTGDLVEITRISMRTEEPIYKSKVEVVINPETVLIHAPVSMGRNVSLNKDDKYYLSFVSQRGVFRFRAVPSANLVVDGLNIVRFRLLDQGERTQRRDFFRFNCAIPIQFAVVNQESGEDTSATMLDGLIRDLGGGGMKMYTEHDIAENTLIRVMLQLNDEYIMAFGKVLHRVKNRDATLPFQYGIKFAAMAKADQEKIIQFLYNEQRKALQRAR